MGKPFDPYHKWLGIPPEEQPPNHYRLLGIKVFETDADVIEAASDQRMSHLRGYQTGRNADLSQRLLNEISAARVCLLNPTKRAVYDEQLQQTIQSKAKAVLAPPPAPDASNPAFPVVTEEWSGGARRRKANRAARRNNFGAIISTIIALILLVGAIAAWQVASREPPAVVTPPAPAPVAPKPLPLKQHSQKPMTSKERPLPKATASIPERPAVPAPPPRKRVEKSLPAKNAKAVLKMSSSDGTDPSSETDEDPSGVKKPLRMPVPSSAEVESSLKQIRSYYRTDIAGAKTAESRHVLALQLLNKAGQEKKGGSPAVAFALCRLARDIAVQGADGMTAFQAVDALAEKFEVEAATMKADVLADLAKKARMPAQHASLADQSAELMEEAAEAGNFPLAAQLGKLAVAESVKGNQRDFAQKTKSRLKEILDKADSKPDAPASPPQ